MTRMKPEGKLTDHVFADPTRDLPPDEGRQILGASDQDALAPNPSSLRAAHRMIDTRAPQGHQSR